MGHGKRMERNLPGGLCKAKKGEGSKGKNKRRNQGKGPS